MKELNKLKITKELNHLQKLVMYYKCDIDSLKYINDRIDCLKKQLSYF